MKRPVSPQHADRNHEDKCFTRRNFMKEPKETKTQWKTPWGIMIKTVLILLLPMSSWAGGVGTTAAQFLKIGVGARAMGMAGAYAAVTDDAHVLYWNPAGIAGMERPQLASTYNVLYQDTSQGFLSYAHPMDGKGVWGVGINYLQVADIEKRTGDTTAALSTFAAKDSALFGSYALSFNNLSLGASLKFIQLKLDSDSASAFALDLGSLYKMSDLPLTFGLSVLNVGTSVKYKSASDPLPLGVKLGAAYKLFNDKLLVTAGGDSWIQESRSYLQCGVEYMPVSILALRTGYQVGRSSDKLEGLTGVSAGMGFTIKKFIIDYAYVPFGNLGDTHRLSFTFTF